MSEDHAQFEQVFEDCYEAVYRYAARRVPPEAVQDVVSDTFLAGWRRHGELKGEPLPWLLGIARRSAANNRRSRARRDALHERLSAEQTPSEEIQLGVEDPRLAAAFATLGERVNGYAPTHGPITAGQTVTMRIGQLGPALRSGITTGTVIFNDATGPGQLEEGPGTIERVVGRFTVRVQ